MFTCSLKINYLPTADEVAAKLADKAIFSTFDMKDGFWNIELDEESSYLCAFNSPFGVYRFTRLPFGINIAPEVFQKFNEKYFSGIDGVHVTHDDIIIAGVDEKDHDLKVNKFLQRAKEINIRLNPDKMQLRTDSLKYLGFIITKNGLKPDLEKVDCINNMPEPQHKKDLQRFWEW